MKTLLLNTLLIVILLVSCSSPSDSYTPEQSKIIGTPYKIGSFEVAQNDFPNQMNWNDAKKACEGLGNGWRLPTKDELNLMYKNRKKIGGFALSTYWSSTEVGYNNDGAWIQDFVDGLEDLAGKDHLYYVRSVRAF
jgi:nitrous oxide reductase accessory protein NosL